MAVPLPEVLDHRTLASPGLLNGTVRRGSLVAHDGTGFIEADASDQTKLAQGVAVGTGRSGESIMISPFAVLRDNDAPFTANSPVYLSETAGEVTTTKPTVAGGATQRVGWAMTTSIAVIGITGVMLPATSHWDNDEPLYIGDDQDIAMVLRSTTLAANTSLLTVLEGTPDTPAIAANSLILSNSTSNGDILIAVNDGGTSKGLLWFDGSAGQVTFPDDLGAFFGDDKDGAVFLRSTSLAANTALTNVLVGTPVVPAVAANSLLITNVTASGDILLATARGSNSEAHMLLDASAGDTTLYARGVAIITMAGDGDTTISPVASLNVTLNDDDADAFDAANSAVSYLLIDTRNTIQGVTAHTFDQENASYAPNGTAESRLVVFNAFTITYTGTTQITGLQSTVQYLPTTLTNSSAHTVDKATTIEVVAPTEGGSVTLTDASAIRILNASGTPTNQHGILIETLTAGATADYMITLGSTDAAHNLIHVGVTGDPIFAWDETNDVFTFDKGVTVTGTIAVSNAAGGAIRDVAASQSNPSIVPDKSDVNTGLGQEGDTLFLIAGGHAMYRLFENLASANYVAHTIDAPDQVSLTSASGSTWRLIQTQAVNVDWDGGVTITVLAGQTAYFDQITNTADQATTITDASTVHIVGAPVAGSNITITRALALWVDAGGTRFDGDVDFNTTVTLGADGVGTDGEQFTSGGTGAECDWAAASCISYSKKDIVLRTDPENALALMVNTPVYDFTYKDRWEGGYRHTTTGDTETRYTGPMAAEALWAMHQHGRILNPINALGYTMLAFQGLSKIIDGLRQEVRELQAA